MGLISIEGGHDKAYEIPAMTYNCSSKGAKLGRCVYLSTTATLLVCCTAVIMGLICMVKRVDSFQAASRRNSKKNEYLSKTKVTTPSEAQREDIINFTLSESETIL